MTGISCLQHILLASALFLSGCYQVGEVVKQATMAAQQDQTRNDLKELGLAYHNYIDAHNSAP